MNADGTGTRSSRRRRRTTRIRRGRRTASRSRSQRVGDIYVMSAGRLRSRGPDLGRHGGQRSGLVAGRQVDRVRATDARHARCTRSGSCGPDGTERQALTSQQRREPSTPAWSPDSSRIVFASNTDGELYELYTVGVDGKGLRSVVPTAGDNFEPSWSPDGSKIAYSGGRRDLHHGAGGRPRSSRTARTTTRARPGILSNGRGLGPRAPPCRSRRSALSRLRDSQVGRAVGAAALDELRSPLLEQPQHELGAPHALAAELDREILEVEA